MTNKAIDQIPRLDFRYHRAQAFAATLMRELRDVLPNHNDYGAVYDRVMKAPNLHRDIQANA